MNLSEQYINAKVNQSESNSTLKSFEEIMVEHSKPFVEHDFKDHDVIEFKNGETKFSLEYESINYVGKEFNIEGLIEKAKTSEPISKDEFFYLINTLLKKKGSSFDDLRQVKNISFSNSNGDIFETKTAYPNLVILFSTEHEKMGPNDNRFEPDNSMVILLGLNILSPVGILAMMHEVGHLTDIGSGSTYKKEVINSIRNINLWASGRNKKLPSNNEAGKLLNTERNAWAYAINKIKPFIEDLGMSKNDLSDFSKACADSYIPLCQSVIEENEILSGLNNTKKD